MALIKCPECGKEKVSDTAMSCPKCGFNIHNYVVKQRQVRNIQTVKNTEPIKEKQNKSNKKIYVLIILLGALTVFVISFAIGYYRLSKKGGNTAENNKIKKEYIHHYNECVQNFNNIKENAENGIKLGDKLVSLTGSVWSDAIFKQPSLDTIEYTYKDDGWQSYSQALNNMYADETVKSTVTSLTNIKNEVTKKFNDIQDVPDELNDVYISAQVFVSAFNDIVDFSVKASGSLSTYATSYQTKKSAYTQALSKFTANIPKEMEE